MRMSKQKTTTMDCSRFNLELQKMLATASDAAAPELDAHMSTCPKCQKAYNRVKLLLRAVSAEQKSTPGFYLQSRIMDRVRAEVSNTLQIKPIRWQTAVASLAAGVMLGLIIGSVSYISSSLSDNSITSAITLQQDTDNSPIEEYFFTSDNDK